MKKFISFLTALLLVLSLLGCGSDKKENTKKESTAETQQAENKNNTSHKNKEENNNGSKKKTEEKNEDKKEPEKETPVTEHTKTFFNSIPSKFTYTSVEGNKTELEFNEDGTFSGKSTLSKKDEVGEGYSKGTVYVCNFSGKFAEPIPMDQYTYISQIERMETEKEKGETYIEKDTRFIVTTPQGLENTKEVIFFLPGSNTSVFPEGTLDSIENKDSIGDTLPEGIFILRSFADSSTFVSYEK